MSVIHLKVFANVDRAAAETGLLHGRPLSETALIEGVVARFGRSQAHD